MDRQTPGAGLRILVLAAVLLTSAGCVGGEQSDRTSAASAAAIGPTVRIALVGDIMLGRGVASVMAVDASSVFEDVRYVLGSADIAGANLESPLTTRSHTSGNGNRLEADPAAALQLAQTGFDVISLANNHTTDAGSGGLVDTLQALSGAGMATLGAGRDIAMAQAPFIRTIDGVDVGFLAFDATGVGASAGVGPGVATWRSIPRRHRCG